MLTSNSILTSVFVLCDCLFQRFIYSMRAIQGALLLASLFHVLVGVFIMPTFGRQVVIINSILYCTSTNTPSLLVKLEVISFKKNNVVLMLICCRLLSPLTTIPVVMLVGLGMFVYGFPQVMMMKPFLLLNPFVF